MAYNAQEAASACGRTWRRPKVLVRLRAPRDLPKVSWTRRDIGVRSIRELNVRHGSSDIGGSLVRHPLQGKCPGGKSCDPYSEGGIGRRHKVLTDDAA